MLIMSLIAIAILSLIFCFLVIPQIYKNIIGKAPFIPTPGKAISAIIEALELTGDSIVYDLGCGNGKVLKAAVVSSGARGVGYEYDWFPFLLAKCNTSGLPISLHYKDIFSADLSAATHVYCYLLPATLAMLEPHVQKSCKPGTKIVTCDFQFPSLPLQKEILIDDPHEGHRRKLFVYATYSL